MSEYFKDFIDNQYEKYNGGKFIYNENVNAGYIEQQQPEYQKNPLIEALPPVYTFEQVVYRLQKVPLFSCDERRLSDEYRIQAIRRLDNYLFVLVKHIEIERKFSMVLRRGYVGKNILNPSLISRARLDVDVINQEWLQAKSIDSECISDKSITSVPGFSIIGISGAGKSASINTLLTMYPQCIIHTEYEGHKFLFRQLTWIKIDCSFDGSLPNICRAFFEEVDSVLGTDYSRKDGGARATADTMIKAMRKIVRIHALGTLIIDEIQHLTEAKSGPNKVLNFLVTLENVLHIPIILLGTYKVFDNVLTKAFRGSRRASGVGEVEFGLMPQKKEWDSFIDDMWEYQWTKGYCPLTDEIRNLLYDKTMGIIDRVIKLFMACQLEAIITDEEIISPALIRDVADKHMPLTKKMIESLKNPETGEYKKFEDLCPSIEGLFEHAKNKVDIEKQLKELTDSIDYQSKSVEEKLMNEIVLSVVQFGINYSDAWDKTKLVINKYGIKKDVAFLKQQVLREIIRLVPGVYDKKSTKAKNKGSGIKKNKDKEEDSTEIKKGYEEYSQDGDIKDVNEF